MKTQLIALVALAAGLVPGVDAEIAEGATFEVNPDAAEALLTEGKAKLANPTRSVKVRLLADCEHGRADDVVELSSSAAKALEKDGLADSDKSAVAFAVGLPQNQPKKRK